MEPCPRRSKSSGPSLFTPRITTNMEKALQVLMRDYDSLNSSQVSELHSTPTPVEFSRFVAANRPVVIRGQGQREGIVALEKWTDQYLVNKLQGKKVAIAVSPDGLSRAASVCASLRC